ncbi:hypothetical protein BC826DRAFT_1176335 [Russula brevipes]|nr:hypothetical protein BC826DRAFT_1176335 [Russula brevipes]
MRACPGVFLAERVVGFRNTAVTEATEPHAIGRATDDTVLLKRAHPDIMHYLGSEEEATGSGARCGDVPPGQFRPRAGCCGEREYPQTLDLIIDVPRGLDHSLGGGGFSIERVPRAAAAVRSAASMTLNECLQDRKRPWVTQYGPAKALFWATNDTCLRRSALALWEQAPNTLVNPSGAEMIPFDVIAVIIVGCDAGPGEKKEIGRDPERNYLYGE